jgi:hypothetical protein
VKPWIAISAGIVLFALGAFGLNVTSTHTSLSSLVVAKPAPGMVRTAAGAGERTPTKVFRRARAGDGIKTSGIVPVTPTLFLEPVRLVYLGIQAGSEQAHWTVWWDAAAQSEDAVSLQQHVNQSSAETYLSDLIALDKDAARFSRGGLDFASSTKFAVPGVAGAVGFLWRGTETQSGHRIPIEFRFAVFSRDSVVAMVSTTAFSRTTDASAFLTLASAEYTRLAHPPRSNPFKIPLLVLSIAGAGLVILGIVLALRARRRRAHPTAKPVRSRGGSPTSGPWSPGQPPLGGDTRPDISPPAPAPPGLTQPGGNLPAP